MKPMTRIEHALAAAIATGEEPELSVCWQGPSGMPCFRAVRIRPAGYCLAVAQACGDDDPALSEAAASASNCLHCASLVHDDLPCFDDSPMRRGAHRSTTPMAKASRCWRGRP